MDEIVSSSRSGKFPVGLLVLFESGQHDVVRAGVCDGAGPDARAHSFDFGGVSPARDKFAGDGVGSSGDRFDWRLCKPVARVAHLRLHWIYRRYSGVFGGAALRQRPGTRATGIRHDEMAAQIIALPDLRVDAGGRRRVCSFAPNRGNVGEWPLAYQFDHGQHTGRPLSSRARGLARLVGVTIVRGLLLLGHH